MIDVGGTASLNILTHLKGIVFKNIYENKRKKYYVNYRKSCQVLFFYKRYKSSKNMT